MQRAAILATVLPLLFLGACGPAATHPAAAAVKAPPAAIGPRIASEEEYAAARADYDALGIDTPDRAGRRVALEGYLLAEVNQALEGNHLEEAFEFLRQALTLYDASELGGRINDPLLATACARLEKAFSRRGGHKEVIVALTAEVTLSDAKAATTVRERYEQVSGWLRSGGTAASDDPSTAIDGRENVIDDLEAAAQLWPSAFVVDQLAGLYLDRKNGSGELGLFNRRLRRGADLGELIKSSGRPGIAYELARLYLRISRPDEALAQLSKLKGQPTDDVPLRSLVEKVNDKTAQAEDTVKLAAQFAQQGRADADVALRICRDGARRFPQASEPRICAGRFAASLEPAQLVVALKNFEEAVRLEPGLGRLYQARLMQVVSDENLNLGELDTQLKKVEAFHAQVEKRFPDKHLRPSMADALFEVGRGYYNAGHLKDAQHYLERSIALQPTPQSLELDAQIRLKKGDGKEAAALFDRATNLPELNLDKGNQLWWRAKLRRQMADALEVASDAEGATTVRKAALADWDVLIGYGLTPEALAESGLEKAKLLYQNGEREASLDSFQKAIDAAPDRGSTYADVIAWLVARGELEEALDAYHRALGRNEVTDYLKVYCSLWIVDLARRAGEPADPLATAYLQSTDGGKWYDDLARWATGRESEATLLSHADTPARKAESAFYRGMRAVADGKSDDAKHLWKQVLDTDMMAFFEYDMAAYYLKVGGAPAHPVLKPRPREPRPPAPHRPPDGSI